ncbi:hypothetical protein [Pseudomonas fluorescens]|uniref:hypothetical protein n=1 Tax=Pseudomonas fluorescens TaxID=294 RepID=UPI00123F0513|nr:hypothetical protein [Pseudomonas fluorescens]VVN23468.1 hypothetical protein PS639_04413 [Pseudomonas fluorescens]
MNSVSFRHHDKFYAEVDAVTLYEADGYLILTHTNDDSSSIFKGAEALFEVLSGFGIRTNKHP